MTNLFFQPELVKYGPTSQAEHTVLATRDPNWTHWPILQEKGTWREAKFPLSIAMVPKAGFEPARVSPPPPQDGVVCAGFAVRVAFPPKSDGEYRSENH